MIARGAILLLLFGLLGYVALSDPPQTPEAPLKNRWVKVDARGETMGPWEGPWRCVYDSQSGLLWEVKTYVEDLHDLQCSFSWFDTPQGSAKGGNCFTPFERSDTRDIATVSNTEQRCGVKGWRLPKVSELRTLLIEDYLPGGPQVALEYFPYTGRGNYWSATQPQERLACKAYGVNMMSGTSRLLPCRDAAFVRLVSSDFRVEASR